MRCTACDSENVRRLSAVWEEGTFTQHSTARTTTKGRSNFFGGGQMGTLSGTQSGTTHTTTHGTTELARRAARPSPETPIRDALVMLGGGAVAIFVIGVIVAVATSDPVAFLLMAVLAGLLVARVVQLTRRGLAFNRSELPGLRNRWERSWWCSKCGEVFEDGGVREPA
jgi:hypothetical protein